MISAVALVKVKFAFSVLEMWKTSLNRGKQRKRRPIKAAGQAADAAKRFVILKMGIPIIGTKNSHLPYGADTFQAQVLIRRVYEELLELGIKSVPGFAVPFGVQTNQFERNHLFGNCCIRENTFIALVTDLVISMNRSGFKKFVLCVNHSENDAALNTAAKALADEYGIQCLVADWVPPMNDFWPTVLKNAEHQGHGGEDETACVMAAVPGLVKNEGIEPYYPREDKEPVKMSGLHYYGGAVGIYLPVAEDTSPGYIGNPADATAEEGILCYDAYAKWIARVVQKYFG